MLRLLHFLNEINAGNFCTAFLPVISTRLDDIFQSSGLKPCRTLWCGAFLDDQSSNWGFAGTSLGDTPVRVPVAWMLKVLWAWQMFPQKGGTHISSLYSNTTTQSIASAFLAIISQFHLLPKALKCSCWWQSARHVGTEVFPQWELSEDGGKIQKEMM